MTLVNPTDRDDEIYSCAEELFDKFWIKNEPVRLIGVGLTGFIEEPNRQLSLWDDPEEEKQADDLQSTLDNLKDKFGESMIKRASDLDYSQRDDNKR